MRALNRSTELDSAAPLCCAARVRKWHGPADFRAAAIPSGIEGSTDADAVARTVFDPKLPSRKQRCRKPPIVDAPLRQQVLFVSPS